MRIPDWVYYLVVLIAVLFSVYNRTESYDAPPAPPPIDLDNAPVLPPPSIFDPDIIVQVDRPQDGIGTAFSVASGGAWLTARHVVDGCNDLAIQINRNSIVRVDQMAVAEDGDLALLFTGSAPAPNALDLSRDLRVGQYAFHIGYPQGKAGEVTSRLISRSRLVTSGRFSTNAPVLAWSELGRTRGLYGTLGGMSGGPTYDSEGEVIGITVAETPRRGRIYTVAPSHMEEFLVSQSLTADGDAVGELDVRNYATEADRLRRELAVVKVLCRVEQN